MQKTVTLVITGGIAAYKSLILIRRLKDAGIKVVPVMTKWRDTVCHPSERGGSSGAQRLPRSV